MCIRINFLRRRAVLHLGANHLQTIYVMNKACLRGRSCGKRRLPRPQMPLSERPHHLQRRL